jgi:hypothetical protein
VHGIFQGYLVRGVSPASVHDAERSEVCPRPVCAARIVMSGNTTFVARVFIKLDARTRGE